MLYLNQQEIFRGTSCCIRLVVNLLRTTVDKGAANPRYPHASPSPPQKLGLCNCWRACRAYLQTGRHAGGGHHTNTHPWLWATKLTCPRSDTFYFGLWVLFWCQQPWQSIRVGERNQSGMLSGLSGFLPCPI